MGRTKEIDRDQEDHRSPNDRPRTRPRQQSPAVPAGVEIRVTGAKGTVMNVVADRGFAFVDGENGVRYFAHFSVCLPDNRMTFDNLKVGAAVIFDGIPSDKGPRCEALRLAE